MFSIHGLAALAAFCLSTATSPAEPVVPLIRAHAHNDYEHRRPLADALAHGFCSVEADVHLVGGKLLVAHDLPDARPDRTIETLYLEPLAARAKSNGGRIYAGGPTVILLVDIKSESEPTYRVLRQTLERYSSILTSFSSNEVRTNAVTVIVSGNRPRELMESEETRLAGYDGRLPDLGREAPHNLIPLISENWRNAFRWDGTGPFPSEERARLRNLVEMAGKSGRKLRFWATPDTPAAWNALLEAGVDLINTDDLAGLSQFLLQNDPLAARALPQPPKN